MEFFSRKKPDPRETRKESVLASRAAMALNGATPRKYCLEKKGPSEEDPKHINTEKR